MSALVGLTGPFCSTQAKTHVTDKQKPHNQITETLRMLFRWSWLAFLYGAFGATVGLNVGSLIPATMPETTAVVVGVSVAVCVQLGWLLGNSVGLIIDRIGLSKPSQVPLKWVAGVVGFLIYCILNAVTLPRPPEGVQPGSRHGQQYHR